MMRYLLMMSALLCLSGCGQSGGAVDDGDSMYDEPQVIIETGYLRCTPAAGECDGALTCTTEADESVCVEAEAEECVGEASCACEGAWVCGDRACTDVDGGFECSTPPSADDVCTPEDCGEQIFGGLCDDGQPYEITCERNDGGSCEWVVGECQEPPAECQIEDCGEQIFGGLCDDGQPYEITCERNDGGSCEWVVGECQEPPAECQIEDCGEQISGGLCDDGQPYEITCERNDGGSCEWVVGECVSRSVDRQLTVDACPPVEMANDPYEMRSVELQGDTLYVGVEYGGGCGEHGFVSCPSDFRESIPLQMTVSLSHDSNGDTCEALMSEMIAIDLTWIREQHQAQFSGAEREVNVTIQGPNGGESFLYSY